ncbi:hypothetical protein VITFI_CDS0616 [Vitreoscilla filiformis]|jgi:hypothetical protein|uniref:Uncharacterized protein n=1 Tax=Vitreoscilla filiformis TaxID=63 RepID=A0A221KBN7_VITFI|nr:hypothetical protein VITFI_CDS0616 [Vitreoscilla filiformis]
MTVPHTLEAPHRLHAAMLFFQYQMKLPFPLQPASNPLWPDGLTPASLRQH